MALLDFLLFALAWLGLAFGFLDHVGRPEKCQTVFAPRCTSNSRK